MPTEVGTQAIVTTSSVSAWLDPGLRQDDVKGDGANVFNVMPKRLACSPFEDDNAGFPEIARQRALHARRSSDFEASAI
jgi:hypothetical protein